MWKMTLGGWRSQSLEPHLKPRPRNNCALKRANAVYCRRKGQTVWMKVGVFTQSEVMDATPCAPPGQPEEREYQVRSVIKDVEIGIASDIETVIVRG